MATRTLLTLVVSASVWLLSTKTVILVQNVNLTILHERWGSTSTAFLLLQIIEDMAKSLTSERISQKLRGGATTLYAGKGASH